MFTNLRNVEIIVLKSLLLSLHDHLIYIHNKSSEASMKVYFEREKYLERKFLQQKLYKASIISYSTSFCEDPSIYSQETEQ